MITGAKGPLLLLAIGTIGGFGAYALGAPIPFLLGSLMSVATFVIIMEDRGAAALTFPTKIREVFVAIIGTMIGSTFTPEGVMAFQNAWASFGAMLIFIPVALATNYFLFKKFGGYDRATAFYSSMPGGLVDSVVLGEQAGGDPKILSIQHFVRIVIIVTTVPLGFWLFTGEAVGSAAGMTLDVPGHTTGPIGWVVLIATAFVGYWAGRLIKLPAYFLMGPMIAAGIVHGLGLTEAQFPDWLLSLSQLIIGVGFGARFSGLKRRMLVKGLGLGLLTTSNMLFLGAALSLILTQLTDEPFDVLLLCLAPGGIIEMGLIALSLNANPVFVSTHHLLRIVVAVTIASTSFKWVKG